jgi:hypothetical protein
VIETRDMEGDLRLVREGHRDRLALHGVRTPRTGPDGGRVPWPKPCGLAPVSALPTLHERHASQRVSDAGAVWQGANPAHAEVASVARLAAMGGVTPQGTRGMLPDGLGGVRMRQSWALCHMALANAPPQCSRTSTRIPIRARFALRAIVLV